MNSPTLEKHTATATPVNAEHIHAEHIRAEHIHAEQACVNQANSSILTSASKWLCQDVKISAQGIRNAIILGAVVGAMFSACIAIF